MRFGIVTLLITSLATVQAVIFGLRITDKYDDLGTTLGAAVIPTLVSDGGIAYNNFKYVTVGAVNGIIPQLTGIDPQSGKNVALLQMPASGSFSTTARCFKLSEFYAGCTTANLEGTVNKPLRCKMTLKAYNAGNEIVDTKEVEFIPNGLLKSTMNRFAVDLKPAKTVTMDVAILNLGSIGSAATAALLDDVSYTQYDQSNTGRTSCGEGF